MEKGQLKKNQKEMAAVKEICNGHLTSKVFVCKMCEDINHHWKKNLTIFHALLLCKLYIGNVICHD